LPNIGLVSAFFAGIISFITPCVLPLIPGYLSYVSGVSMEEIEKADSKTQLFIFYRAALFCLGFAVIFTSLGVAASLLGVTIALYRSVLEKIAGVIIIFMGLIVAGVIKPSFLNRDARINLKKLPSGPIGAVLLGMAFAIAWTPCVGPVLSAILLYASTAGNAAKGGLLLLIYSMGLAIPLILTALFFSRMLSVFSWIKKRYQVIMAVSGGFLVLMGLLLLSGQFGYFNAAIQKLYWQFNFNPF
jgi:cytochrome c-type biogenesis protein